MRDAFALVSSDLFKNSPTAMTLRTLRPPTVTTDRDGKTVLLIPLANTDRHAKVFPEDYHRLLAEGFSPNWCLNRGTVKVSDWRHNAPRAARLIVGLKSGERFQVRHRDGDPFNCRRDNLRVMPVKLCKSLHHRAA